MEPGPGVAEAHQRPDLFVSVQALLRGTSGLDEVERALSEGADPNRWQGPLTPLRCAVQAKNPRLLQLLLRKGADTNIKDQRGVGPLHVAVFDGRSDCVKLLLEAVANPNIRDRHGQTPLFFAPSRQVCELLMARRADVDAKNAKKQSPLHHAAKAGLSDVLNWFAEVNRKILDVQDAQGRTPLYYAAHSKVKSTVGVLQQRGALDKGLKRSRRPKTAPVPATESLLPSPVSSPSGAGTRAAGMGSVAQNPVLAETLRSSAPTAEAQPVTVSQLVVEVRKPASADACFAGGIAEADGGMNAFPGACLKVLITSAQGLRDADFVGKSDPFCVCAVEGRPSTKFTTRVAKDTGSPEWNQEVELRDITFEDVLVFEVFDEDVGKSPDLLGRARLDGKDIFPAGFQGELPLEDGGKSVRAFLTVRVLAAGQEQSPPEALEAAASSQRPHPRGVVVPSVAAELTEAQRPGTSEGHRPGTADATQPGTSEASVVAVEAPLLKSKVPQTALVEASVVAVEAPLLKSKVPQPQAALVEASVVAVEAPLLKSKVPQTALIEVAPLEATTPAATAEVQKRRRHLSDALQEKEGLEEDAESGVDDTGFAVHQCLTQAAADGSLQQALGRVDQGEGGSEDEEDDEDDSDAEDTGLAVYQYLIAAAADGSLQQALGQGGSQDEEDDEGDSDAEDTGLAVHQCLIAAAADGSLQQALGQERAAGEGDDDSEDDEDDSDAEDTGLAVHQCLIAAAADGSLQQALGQERAAGEDDADSEESGTDTVRLEMHQCLTQAAVDGSLQKALELNRKPGGEAPLQSVDEEETLRFEVHQSFTKAVADGSLKQALKASPTSSPQPHAEATPMVVPEEATGSRRSERLGPNIEECVAAETMQMERPDTPLTSSPTHQRSPLGRPSAELTQRIQMSMQVRQAAALRGRQQAVLPSASGHASSTTTTEKETSIATAEWESEDSSEARRQNRVPNKEVQMEESDGCYFWEVLLRKETPDDKFGFVQANGKLEFEARLANPSQRPTTPSQRPTPIRPPEDSPLQGPSVLIVRRIHEGALLDVWNKKYPNIAVHSQDRICSVNADPTLDGMQREIRQARILIKFMRYPEHFSVQLKKEGRRLGFRFERPPPGVACQDVRITEILKEGALPEYNLEQVARQRWHLAVLPDMRIIGVNSIMGDGEQIAEELKRCDEVKLHIARAEYRMVTPTQAVRAMGKMRAVQRLMQLQGTPSGDGSRGAARDGRTGRLAFSSSSSSDGRLSSPTASQSETVSGTVQSSSAH